MKTSLIALTAVGALAPLFVQDTSKPAAQDVPKSAAVVKAADVKWGDHPYIQGGKMCVQDGDPAKGPSVLMMKFPKGMTIPAHWHTSDEIVTVIAGSVVFGSGEKADESKGTLLSSGAYAIIPGKSSHWAVVKEDLLFTAALNRLADFHLCGEGK